MERETAGARKRVEDAETAIKQEQEDMRIAESGVLTFREPGQTFEEMMDAIGESLSDLASSEDEEDGDHDEDTEQGNLSEDDEPSWVMSIISKTIQQRMERFRQKKVKLDELTHPGWGDAADYFCERDKKYGRTELNVLAVVKLHTDDNSVIPAPITFRELMQSVEIIPGILQLLQATSWPGSSHMRLGSERPQWIKHIASLPPDMEPDSSLIQNAKPLEPISLYPCIFPSS